MEERRHDYPQILEALSEIRSEMAKISVLVEERNTTAIEWRGEVCKKFDKIFVWLAGLPCKERNEMYKNRKTVDVLMWGAIGVIFGILVAHIGWR